MPASRALGGTPSAADVIFLGSADIESTNGITLKWWSTGLPPTVTTPAGVHDRCWDTASAAAFFTLPTPLSTFSVGMRFLVRIDVNGALIRFRTPPTTEHIEIDYVAGGAFRVDTDLSTTLDSSASGLIALNTWYFVEITGVVHDTNGSILCKLYDDSGTLLDTLSAGPVDTRDGGATGSEFQLGNNNCDPYFEDLYIDASGTLHGRSQVETVGPTGAGDLTQLSPSTGNNWDTVNEKPVSTGDHVTSSGANQIDTYTFPARSVMGTPRAVGVSAACVATSGTPQFRFVCRIAGTTYEHATTHTSSTSGQFFGAYWNNNPATGNAWSDADINSTQFGIKWLATNGRTYGLYRATLVQL